VSIGIIVIGESKGAQAFVMTSQVIIPIGGFSTKNPLPYF
jgi:hypothetical protein